MDFLRSSEEYVHVVVVNNEDLNGHHYLVPSLKPI